MEQLKERFLRPCRKLTDQFLIAAVITFISDGRITDFYICRT